MEYPSKIVEAAVEELSRLPGVGKKTALRLALHILRGTEEQAESLGKAVVSLRKDIRYCGECGNISDYEVCKICDNHRRDHQLLCIVEDCKDVIAIENTHQFSGIYHVLGGVIDPLSGVGPGDLNLEGLVERIKEKEVKEVIFALSSSMEGDTTAFYISRKLADTEVSVSNIARGIPVGGDLEFTDEITLARSFANRTQLNFRTATNGL